MLHHPFEIRSRRTVGLGPVRLEIRSNEPNFSGFRFFVAGDPAERLLPGNSPDFTLTLCNLRLDGPWPAQSLAALRDKSYRAKKMSAGYYLTDHFGAPAYLISRGTDYWICAEDFESILWPYAVKHLLTVYAMEHAMVHLKAASVAVKGNGVLLVGRGESGKTVLLSRLCQAGAQFLSNTHVLMERGTIWGIPTTLRVRQDEFFAPIIAKGGLQRSVKVGEYTADPLADLGWTHIRSAPLKTICLLDYKGPGSRTIREIDRETLFDYMEQFSLAVNVYGLKEDVLDYLGADVTRFSDQSRRTRTALRDLIGEAACYYSSCDAADTQNLRAIWELLGSKPG